MIEAEARNQAVIDVLDHFTPESTLAFCNTKIHCRELTEALQARGISALALYGDLEQRDRDEILVRFSNRSASVLVATDVAARGLDIQSLDLVLNVDVARDQEVHVHRIGRSGRGDEKGLAVTLCADADKKWVKLIEAYQEAPARWYERTEWRHNGLPRPPMITLIIHGGRKDKLRPGDIVGAFTNDGGLGADQVGKINVFDHVSFVGLARSVANKTLLRLDGRIKGRQFKMRLIEE